MPIPSHLLEFWHGFAKAAGGVDESRFYEAFCFSDREPLANDLADLVLLGIKRATTASMWSYEAEGKRLPRPGDLSIVTNWAGQPQCVIETRAVEIVPFGEVTAEFAAIEGEGDGSLAFWQQAHRDYFTRECIRTGRQFSDDMLVACERFDVVYRPPAMSLKRLVPMQPVSHLPTSVAFYEKLGFVVEQRNDDWGWAMLRCGECELMLDQSINLHPGIPRIAVLYLYPDNLADFRRRAMDNGLGIPEIDDTFYGMREFRIDDPDGNRLWIGEAKPSSPEH